MKHLLRKAGAALLAMTILSSNFVYAAPAEHMAEESDGAILETSPLSMVQTSAPDIDSGLSTKLDKLNAYAGSEDFILDAVKLGSVETSAPGISTFSLSTGTVDLASGNHQKWIDRVVLPDGYRTLYQALEESVDNDGSKDYLISLPPFTAAGCGIKISEWAPGGLLRAEEVIGILGPKIAHRNTITDKDITYAYACLDAIFQAFDRDHPEVFWLNGIYGGGVVVNTSTGDCYVYLYLAGYEDGSFWSAIDQSLYLTGTVIDSYIDQRDAAVDTILASVPASSDAAATVDYFNDWLTAHNEYNSNVVSGYAPVNDSPWECISALRGSVGAYGPVCEGYARAFNVLCNAADIPCVLVDGPTDRGAHMWNYVQVEGKWFAVDVTWNDPIPYTSSGAVSGYENDNYLLVGANTIVEGSTFIASHPAENHPTYNGVYFTNGPTLNGAAYIPPAQRQYSSTWSKNETSHWHACLTAGYESYKKDEAAHTWNSTVTQQSTTSSQGQRKDTCTVCGYTRTVTIPCIPAKPYKVTNVVSGVHVYWTAVAGAEKYGVWRSETGKDGTYKWLANPTVPHFTDTTAVSGKTYYYKVTSMSGGSHTNKSEAIGIAYLSTPDITARYNKAAGIKLEWNQITGATGYRIYRKSYDGTDAWVKVGEVTGNATLNWTDTSVASANGEIYRYTVRAVKNGTLSGCRNSGRTMARLTSRTLTSAVKASSTSITCKWGTTAQATGYEVRFLVGSEVYKTFTIGSYKTGVKTFTGLAAGQTYKIQVRSYKSVPGVGSFYSAWSTAKNVTL